MKTVLKIFLVFILTTMLFSCKSERDKKIEQINKESTEIFAAAVTKIIMRGYTINTDSLTTVYTKLAGDSAELGMEYAKKVRDAVASIDAEAEKKEATNAEDGSEQQINTETSQLEIISHNQKIKKETYGKNTCSIYVVVKNNSNKVIDMVFLKATWFDENNDVVAIQTGYDKNIDPGAKSTVEIFSTQVQKEYKYELKIESVDYK